MYKILLIEDEQNVAEFIIQGLEEDEYEVVHVKKYDEALSKLERENIDLVLLDILLPEMNGLEICKNLRNQNYIDLPILMVTALGSPENVVLGLDSGADDYLAKPFKLIELKARIRSLIRRKKEITQVSKQEENKKYHYGFLTIDDYRKVAYCYDQELNLTSTEYRLLLLFIRSPKKVFERSELLEKVCEKHYIVGVSAENYFYTHHLVYLRQLLFISLIFGILLVIVISLFTKRSFMKPIYEMIRQVEKIGSENLHLRLKEPKEKGVLNKLSLTFNNMLNRIETSFETQKNFISNASHELNTPLTSIIGIADVALSKERSVAEYQKSLSKILDAAENLERKTNALLLLARTGFKNNTLILKPVRIDQIVMDAKMTIMEIDKNFRIVIDFSLLPEDSMKLKINGAAPLLQLAISNIISNACKYSDNHTAYVALGALDNKVIVIIKDEGIGIPEQDLDHVYDPYFRASNTDNYQGYGIGLPLSRNIIHMHKGKLSISSTLGVGTTVRIELPSIEFLI